MLGRIQIVDICYLSFLSQSIAKVASIVSGSKSGDSPIVNSIIEDFMLC